MLPIWATRGISLHHMGSAQTCLNLREVRPVLTVGFGSWGGGLAFLQPVRLECREQPGNAEGPVVVPVTVINADQCVSCGRSPCNT